MLPEIDIGPIELQTFGICFALGWLAAGAVLSRRLAEVGKPADWTYEIVFAALIGGLVGSRIDFLIQNWDQVSDDLLGNIFSGSGLVWFGGFGGRCHRGAPVGATGGAGSAGRCATSTACRCPSAT